MDTMVLPRDDNPVWRLAAAGERRYAGGWLRLGESVAWEQDRPQFFAPEPLRIGLPSLGDLRLSAPLWGAAVHGRMSAIDRLLLGCALRMPAYPEGPVPLVLTYRMLLIPKYLRIEIAAHAVGQE